MPKIVEFKNVTSMYPGNIAGLNNVSFDLEEGSFTGLLGPSGAGKSTVLWHIIGELIPDSGTIICMGVEPPALSKNELMRFRRKVGFVPQNLLLLEHRTVYENVNIMLRGIGASAKEADIETMNVLEITGLRERMDAFPYQLSGGEQQRIAIARALGASPQLLMADEPTGNLDPMRSKEIIQLFKRINELGITVLVSTHEWKLMENCGADLLYIDNGVLKKLQTNGKTYRRMSDDPVLSNVSEEMRKDYEQIEEGNREYETVEQSNQAIPLMTEGDNAEQSATKVETINDTGFLEENIEQQETVSQDMVVTESESAVSRDKDADLSTTSKSATDTEQEENMSQTQLKTDSTKEVDDSSDGQSNVDVFEEQFVDEIGIIADKEVADAVIVHTANGINDNNTIEKQGESEQEIRNGNKKKNKSKKKQKKGRR